ISGRFDKSNMLKSTDKSGVTFGEALKNSGYEGKEENRLKEASAFLELQIEQGPVLETESLQISVGDCVGGMVSSETEVTGDSDHAGTTPMPLRKDALFATNNLISEVRQKLSKLDDKLVYTIGRMDVSPNIHTVIPNKIVFSLEARHQDAETIKQVEAIIQALPGSSGREKCEVKATKLWDRDTVW